MYIYTLNKCYQLGSSLEISHRLLGRPKVAKSAIISLLVIHTILLAYSGYVHSPTLNEPGHLVAGISHWKFRRFELYRVNPPLVRMVAAIPVILSGYEEDWSAFHDSPGARPVFEIGEEFIVANGERSFLLFLLARWSCIPFSWVGAIACYLWARDLYGQSAGVLACSLWCFSPTIIAHGSLITADAHATALGIAACYSFWRWLKKPTWLQVSLTGIVLGLAELAKTTLIVFYPIWPLMWLVYRISGKYKMRPSDWLRELGMLLLRMLIGLYVLNLGYGFENSGMKLKEFHFVSKLFAGQESIDFGRQNTSSDTQTSDAASPHNRFSNNWIGNLPVPFPKNYMLGIDIQQRDFENYARPSYLRGEWKSEGWWYYYLYAALIKVPLGVWGLCVILVMHCLVVMRNDVRAITSIGDIVVLLFPAFTILIIVSSKTGFSEHFRYILPCFPFFFIWISNVSTFINNKCFSTLKLDILNKSCNLGLCLPNAALPLLIVFFITWTFSSSLWIYPHSLGYFNEAVAGPLGGPRHLLGSSVDWGQDLRYLIWWDANREDNKQLYLAYFGECKPSAVGLSHVKPFPLGVDSHENVDLKGTLEQQVYCSSLPAGWYAISVNLLSGYPWAARDGADYRSEVDEFVAQRFQGEKAAVMAGTSMLIFRIP